MLGGLTIISGASIILPAIIIGLLAKGGEKREILKYCLVGIVVAAIDFIVEYFGTGSGAWVYHESLYFIFGNIPIELPLLFFSAGIVARFIFTHIRAIKLPVKSNAVFYISILTVAILHARLAYQGNFSSELNLALAILIGLWGMANISIVNRDASIVLATIAALADWVAETVVIGAGGYTYKTGFSILIPLVYGLYTLGLLALMEQLHRLDDFLDSRPVRNLLRLFGVYREMYVQKFEEVRKHISKKIRDISNGHK